MSLEVVPISAIEAVAATAPTSIHHTRPKQRMNGDQQSNRGGMAPLDVVKDRARKYLAKKSGGIQGENGNRPSFRAALLLVNEFALSVEDAYDIFMEVYNGKCEPPWDELEIWRMIGNAEKRRDHRYGSMARDDRQKPQSHDGSSKGGESSRTVQLEDGRHAALHTPVLKLTLGELVKRFPTLNSPVLDGLARQGETVNIISMSKVGKSWLAYCLILCIITGQKWLGRFATKRGKVILIDNELHGSALAHRIPAVAEAMGIRWADHEHDLEVWPLRGNLKSLQELANELDDIEPGTVRAIILDVKYRFVVAGQSENDNGAETLFYNLIDRIAERTGAMIILIHHASKGGQADKRVTDVGSGAGAQSRAADCHLVIREHEEENHVVLDAAVRSFAPVEPIVLKWQFPLWVAVEDGDPSRLKGSKTRNEEKQVRDNIAADADVLAECQTWQSLSQLHRATGMGTPRIGKAVKRLSAAGFLETEHRDCNGNMTECFRKTIHAR